MYAWGRGWGGCGGVGGVWGGDHSVRQSQIYTILGLFSLLASPWKEKACLFGRRECASGTFSLKQMFQTLLNNSVNITPTCILLFCFMVRFSQMLACCLDHTEFTLPCDSNAFHLESSKLAWTVSTCLPAVPNRKLNDTHKPFVQPETTLLKTHRNR